MPGLPGGALALAREIKSGALKSVHRLEWFDYRLEALAGLDSLWVFIRRKGKGGLALRTAYAPGGLEARLIHAQPGEVMFETDSAYGRHQVRMHLRGVSE